MTPMTSSQSPVYQGQFGEFTITPGDRTGVLVYRAGLMVAALCFATGTTLILGNTTGLFPLVDNFATNVQLLTPLYVCFYLALGVSLVTIHIYLAILHRVLQIFWAIGGIASLFFALKSSEPLATTVYNNPLALVGVGFTFAALTGIYFKEAFCFDRLETKFLTPMVPVLLLGHLAGILPVPVEQFLLATWAVLFVVFALRKTLQAIPADIGDKSVFTYLKSQRSLESE
jgi:uncharacterized integral membrane protein